MTAPWHPEDAEFVDDGLEFDLSWTPSVQSVRRLEFIPVKLKFDSSRNPDLPNVV